MEKWLLGETSDSCTGVGNRWIKDELEHFIVPESKQVPKKKKKREREIKSVNPKGNGPWIFIRRTYAETPIFWQPDAKSQIIGKDTDAGKDWWQEEKETTEDEMVG